MIIATWVDRHVSKHVICCAKTSNHACLFSPQSHDNLNPNYLHHPANCFVGAILCTFVCLDKNCVWNDGIDGHKSRVDSEITTKSPRYEQRGRIQLGSLEY